MTPCGPTVSILRRLESISNESSSINPPELTLKELTSWLLWLNLMREP
jgi:hypothetical protein